MRSYDRTMLASFGFADDDKRNPRHDLACQYIATPEVALRLAERICAAEFSQDVVSNDKLKGTDSFSVGYISKIEQEFMLCKGEDQYKTTVGFFDVLIDVVMRRQFVGQIAKVVKKEFYIKSTVMDNDKVKWVDVTENEYNELQEIENKYKNDYEEWCKGKPKPPMKTDRYNGMRYIDSNHPDYQKYQRDLADYEKTIPARPPIPSRDLRDVTEWHDGKRVSEFAIRVVVEVKAGVVPISDIIRQIKLYRGFYFDSKVYWVLATCYGMNRVEMATLSREGIHHVALGPKFEAWVDGIGQQPATFEA